MEEISSKKSIQEAEEPEDDFSIPDSDDSMFDEDSEEQNQGAGLMLKNSLNATKKPSMSVLDQVRRHREEMLQKEKEENLRKLEEERQRILLQVAQKDSQGAITNENEPKTNSGAMVEESAPKKEVTSQAEQGDAILGQVLQRDELKGFEDKIKEKYDEKELMQKVDEIAKKKKKGDNSEDSADEEEKKAKKKAKKRKQFMKNLADPLLFNGVAKGVVIMYIFYHYKTAKVMSSDRLKHALSSMIDFDTVENMEKFKEMKALYSVDIDLMNACIKYSSYILHLLIGEFREDNYLQEILEDHGVIFDSDKTLNQYLLAWMHVILLGMLGVKARVIVPFKFDMFNMDKIFNVKRYESKAYKEKWSRKITQVNKKRKVRKKEEKTKQLRIAVQGVAMYKKILWRLSLTRAPM